MYGEAWGIVEPNASPRPAYRSLQVASGVLRDIVQARRSIVDGDVVIAEMRRKDGARVVTAYAKSGRATSVTITAETSAAVLINSAGGYSPLLADASGNYVLQLPEATGRDFSRASDYVVGGPMLILVENDQNAPVTTITTDPITQDRLRVVVRWQGDDGQYGTGIEKYIVEVSDNGEAWKPWLTDTTDTEGIYDISKGGTFGFRARAVDKVGNEGDFSTPAIATNKLVGILSGHIIDLRGQNVPSARIQLHDGSLYDADPTGWVHVELPPGTAQVMHIDGGIQGTAGKQAQAQLNLGEETSATWLVLPKNLIENGDFTYNLNGWDISSPQNVARGKSSADTAQSVLLIGGQRGPWGPPSASFTLDLPPELTGAVLDFSYRLPVDGYVLRLRAVAEDSQSILWQNTQPTHDRTRVVLDIHGLAGRKVTFRFEMWAPKNVTSGIAEIDDVLLGNVPITQPTPTPTP
jgi:hypothetical protein